MKKRFTEEQIIGFLREAEIVAPRRCAKIHVDQRVLFVAGHARFAQRL